MHKAFYSAKFRANAFIFSRDNSGTLVTGKHELHAAQTRTRQFFVLSGWTRDTLHDFIVEFLRISRKRRYIFSFVIQSHPLAIHSGV